MAGSQQRTSSQKIKKKRKRLPAPVSPIAAEDWDKECEEAEKKLRNKEKEEMEKREESQDENYTLTDSQSEGEYPVTTWCDYPLRFPSHLTAHAAKNSLNHGQKRGWSLLEDSSEGQCLLDAGISAHLSVSLHLDSPGVDADIKHENRDSRSVIEAEPPSSNAFLEYRSERVVTPCKFHSSLEQPHTYDPAADNASTTSEDDACADATLPLTLDYQNQLEIKSASSKAKTYLPPHQHPEFTPPTQSPAESRNNPSPANGSFRFLSDSNDWTTPSPVGFGRGRPIAPVTNTTPVYSLNLSDVDMKRNSLSPSCWTLSSPCGPVLPNNSDVAETSSRMRILQAQQSMMARSRVSDLSNRSSVSGMAPWKKTYQSRYFGLSTPFIDTHCHIDFIFKRTRFNGTYPQYLNMHADTVPENYAGCVTVFCDPTTFVANSPYWRAIVAEKNVWGTVGCHPKRVQIFTPQREDAMREMLKHPKMVALGEIGLDYSGNCGSYAFEQKQVFERQLRMAVELDKSVVIHCRDAESDCIGIMEKILPRHHKIHRHCFTGTLEEARVWMHKFPNSYIGFTPLITQSASRAFHPCNVAAQIDLRKLLLETDAPYFLPWVIPRGEMEYSHPGMAISVAWKIAQLKNLPIEEVLRVCLQNSKDMYGI